MQYEVLNRNNDFRRIYARGKVQAGPILVTYVCKNRAGRPGVGITVSKKVGKAVRRNRARRVIREAYGCWRAGGKECGRDFCRPGKDPLCENDGYSAGHEKTAQSLGCDPMKYLLIYPIKFYRKFISPHLPPACRFYPTCSQYALTAIERFGFFKGRMACRQTHL